MFPKKTTKSEAGWQEFNVHTRIFTSSYAHKLCAQDAATTCPRRHILSSLALIFPLTGVIGEFPKSPMDESRKKSHTHKSSTNELQPPIETHNVLLTPRLLVSRILWYCSLISKKNRHKMRDRVSAIQLTDLANVPPYAHKLCAQDAARNCRSLDIAGALDLGFSPWVPRILHTMDIPREHCFVLHLKINLRMIQVHFIQ